MSRLRLGKRFLARGESLVATLGLSGSLILLAAVGASWWWSVHTHRATLHNERQMQLDVAAGVAARSIEILLGSSDPQRRALRDGRLGAADRFRRVPSAGARGRRDRLLGGRKDDAARHPG